MQLDAKNTGTLLMVCGALHDLAEFKRPRPEQLKILAERMEKVVVENTLVTKLNHKNSKEKLC